MRISELKKNKGLKQMFRFCLSALLSIALGSCGQRTDSLCVSIQQLTHLFALSRMTARMTGSFK